jgi:deazaflavin-dependent oxidoreductase (nitroreductase family)
MPTDDEFLTSNQNVIQEFRANSGVVSQLEFPVLLLTTTGARTGRRTTTPLGYSNDRDCVFVVASKGGAPTNPAWFHNLRANPSVTVELGSTVYQARATVVDGEERDRLYAIISAEAPSLRAFEQDTTRRFPIVVLEGVPSPRAAGASQARPPGPLLAQTFHRWVGSELG